LDKLFAAAATSLQTFPHRGRPGAIPATRELFPHENYRLVYVVASGTVTIIALVHAARNWPP
jgi:plasmid stabilization system protein ParE